MKNVLKELKDSGFYDYTKESNNKIKSNYIQLFHYFNGKSQAIDFLYNHSTDDIKHLFDKIQPNNRTISMKEISDTLNCVGIFQELKKKDNLKEIMEYIKEKMENNDILNWFKNFSETYRGVIELNQNFDFSLHIYEEIDVIIKYAKFIFNKTNDEFKYKVKKDGVEKFEIIRIEKIRELKNKIQIKEEANISSSNKNTNKFFEKYEKLKFFKDLSKNIEEIYDLMDTLRKKGSTLPISIIVEIEYPKINYFLSQKKKEFKDIYNFLSNAKLNIIKKLEIVYKQMTTMRFLYGKEIDSILRHIEQNHYFKPFLRYILNLTDCEKDVKLGKKESFRKVDDYITEYNRYNDISFDIIHKYIVSLFQENNLSIEEHYKRISIIKGHNLKGFYKFLSKSSSMEEDILQIFLDVVDKMPIAQNILISNKETSYEEMQAFFNRAILCKYNSLFVVEINNSFSDYQQKCMNIFINKLLTYKNKIFNEGNEKKEIDKSDTSSYMESCLVFIYNKESETFLNELKYLKINNLSLENDNHGIRKSYSRNSDSNYISDKDSFRDHIFNNTHIVQSVICGLGKSTKIKNTIIKSGKKYNYFPLGGNITKNKIYSELEKIIKGLSNMKNYNDVAIHLDLFETNEHSILNEFLFSILITKFYSNNENIVYIPINIEIYVEIPNCFNNFMKNNKILKLFKKDEVMIKIDDIPKLELPEKKKLLFKNMIEKSTNEEIFEWVKDNMKIPKYSYHQINIFINLFLSQYNKFEGEKLIFHYKNKDPKEVTKNCISIFAEGTKYFTYGGFSKLLLEWNHQNNNEKDEIIDLLSKEYDNDLSNENFDKKLIFIVKNNKVIKNKNNFKHSAYDLDISTSSLEKGAFLRMIPEEKKKLEKIKNSYSLEDYKKIVFLTILKVILDLKNPVVENEEDKEQKEENLKPLFKITNDGYDKYVITEDNFRKMILILYRIIANIPVILMGETGCGKTTLIKKLNQLLNNGELKLKILDINPSFDDNKLIDEMSKINEDAKKNIEEMYWVFFDELNTCDSLSLITEIFINRSFNNIKLSDNIRLIGACNPYRKRKRGANICGLAYPNDDNDLIYLVNILPQSLFYYVFNFGSLDSKNENQYISSILSDTIFEENLKEETKNIISKCHEYLRDAFDKSIVSLRELTRFKKIYKFFIEYFKNKNACLKNNGNPQSEKLKSIIISIYLCYYIRLVDGNLRSKFDNDLNKDFIRLVNYNNDYHENDLICDNEFKKDLQENYGINDFNNFHFKDILSKEEDFIIEKINPGEGIGKNKSLKENIFLLFTSLNTNIPLIIIGKPGSSKSLSAQLICKEMSGKYSSSDFFKYYPQIIQSYFQGSDSTTPSDVEGIFQIAEGRLNALKEKNNPDDLPISMILFDELGLAERSKYNPLKALHSHLDFDGNKKGVSFVGISNWILDAAKLNRALCLSVPDLDDNLNDVKSTCISIAESINFEFANKPIFEKILPNVYFNFKDYLKVLKILTVYKQYELQRYKVILYKYRDNEKFQDIFQNEDKFNIFFQKRKEIKEEEYKKIFEYETFKKFKNNIRKFIEEEEEQEEKIQEIKKKLNEEKQDYFNEIKEEEKYEEKKENNNKIKEKEEKKEKQDKNKSIIESKEFKKLYINDKIINIDFHGNRDFFFLIRGIANELNENNNSDLKRVVKKYIERNFGGFEIYIDFEKEFDDSIEMNIYKKYKKFLDEISKKKKWSSVQLFKKIFNLYCSENDEKENILDEADIDDYNYINNIIENIKDKKSRYLLLETKPSLSLLIKQKIEKEIKKEVFFFEGSPFINDNSNEYQFKIISQIQEHAERDDILILQNINQVYAFLYDLFNKNFIKKDKKNYARICQGNFSDQLTLVNESFRIIILVNKHYLDKVEPPLLNRFEKMILYFSEMVTENQRKLADIIINELDIKKYKNELSDKIQYELEDLLIGCKKEDILGMIYYELDSNENKNMKEKINEENEIKNKIFKKLFKLLPQDIIVFLDKNNDLKKLYYEKKNYYNLKSYIEKDGLRYKISIIYTFQSITDIINDIDDSTRFKMISEIKSEIQLENIINSFITEKSNKNQNFIYINFDSLNSKKMSFLTSFVKNNFYKNKEIKFIFIVHIKRNFIINKSEEKSDKIYSLVDIDPDINQLFIDNLNGPDIKLKEIASNPFQSLMEKGLLKIDEEFNDALNKFTLINLKELKGENDIITEDNYLKKLEEYFEKNRKFKNSIIKKINSFISENKEISYNNIIEKVYESKLINKSTIDLISVIIEYVKNEINSKFINIILCILEDNNILTTLLFINNSKNLKDDDEFYELVDEIMEKYLKNLIIEKKNYYPKFSLNFVVPGFYDFYRQLSYFINKNIKNEFINNEKRVRFFLEENSKENSYDVKEYFFKKEKALISLTFNEIEKKEFYFEFIKKIKIKLLLNDYITFFLFNNYYNKKNDGDIFNQQKIIYNDYKYEIINLLLDERFEKKEKIEDDSIKSLLLKIIWIEANNNYIIKILRIYDILANIFNNKNELLKLIKKVLNNEKLRYITNEKKNPEITSEVNTCYYKLIASLCYSIIPPNINLKRKIEQFDYIDIIKKAIKLLRGLNDELIIYSIEIEFIEEFIKIYDIFALNDKVDYERLNDICASLKRSNELLCLNIEIQPDELIEEYTHLIELIGISLKNTDIKFFNLLKFIYFKETKKVYNVIYRCIIFNDILKNSEIIVNSNDILQILLFPLVKPHIDKFPESINQILNTSDYDFVLIIESILNQRDNEIYYALSETLLYYFEKNSFIYFNNILHSYNNILFEFDEDKNKENVGPLKLFQNCIIFLNLYNKGNYNNGNGNKNLCKLFCIGYIRAYCYKFIQLIDSCSPQLEKSTKIIAEINKSKSLNKVISFYIWKIIYYRNNQNINIFIDPEYDKKYKLSEYKCFKKIEPNINPFEYNYINPKTKSDYNQFLEVLEKYKEKSFEEVKIEDFENTKFDIDIFYYSTCNLILTNLKQKYAFESLFYKNFYKNVCCPLFNKKEKLFNAIKILYDPLKYKKLKTDLGINSDNLSIILHSYRYFINELDSNKKNSIYNVFYSRYISIEKINNKFYPGNDISDLPIYSLFSKIKQHFEEIPNQGCFVCFCNKGGFYHNIRGGIPGPNHLNLKCKNCDENIGAIKNERGFIKPIKRDNYYKVLKTKNEANNDAKINNDKYNIISLEEAKEKYLYKEFQKEKGISKSDENFLKNNSKIIRFLSQISYRILNFILYSHIFFSKIYNNYEELDIFLPKNMSWIKVLTECWEMIKFELKKLDINSIEIFMNYIFSDLFSALNEHENLTDYTELINFEKELDELINKKIIIFKEEYKKINILSEFDSKDKYFFQNVLDERYRNLNNDEYPFYNYFYYSDYVNEDYLLNILSHSERERYPVLLKVLEKNNNEKYIGKYSLDNLPMFNEVLNLFNEKYSYSIKRVKANNLKLKDLKDEKIYINNKGLIKGFINFYNSLQLTNESNGQILILSEDNPLSDFFIDDNNEFGKSYKYIYHQFINQQNNEISELLDKKIEKGIFESNCKNTINIQSADDNDIFTINLPNKFSFIEVLFNCSYRKFAITKDYETYKQIEINIDEMENRMTELLLTNKKMFDNYINNFVYMNENLEFENKNIITLFNDAYEIENINLGDKIFLYKFYQENKENENLFKTIFNDFIQLIIFLNNNKESINQGKKNALYINDNNKIYEVFNTIGYKISDNFKEIFKNNDSFIISKTTYLFEYFRNLIFGMFKSELKEFQTEINKEEENLIDNCFKTQNIITKDIFKNAIRNFIILFLNLVNDKENNIKENQSNIINSLDIPDIWDKTIYRNKDFHNELNNLKKMNIKINQIVLLYDLLGDDINDNYFEEVKNAIKKEEENKKIEGKQDSPINEIVSNKEESEDDDDYDTNFLKKKEDDFGDRDYV